MQSDNVQIKHSILPKFHIGKTRIKNLLKSERTYLKQQKQKQKLNSYHEDVQKHNYKSNIELDTRTKAKYIASIERFVNQPLRNSQIKNVRLVKAEQRKDSGQSNYLLARRIKSQALEDRNLSTCLQSINQSSQQKQFNNSRSFQAIMRNKLMSTNQYAFRVKKSTDSYYKVRSKSEQINKMLSRIQRINKFNQERIRNSLESKRMEVRYKNQKLNILHQQFYKIIRAIPQHMKDQKKFDRDIRNLIQYFMNLATNQSMLNRQNSQNYRTFIGKLIFFIGYQIQIKFQQQHQRDNQQIILTNYYQIYFAMKFKIPLLILQCYLVLIDLALQAGHYLHAQKYAQKCLLASIYYNEKYYQHRCIEKLSMCQYYKGNIYQATYLHDNNGDITQDSKKKVRDGYNQHQQLQTVFHHLYEMPRFDYREVLADYNNRIDNYKTLIIFKNPRIGPDQSMKHKMDQLKIDLIKMERFKQFKSQVGIIKKQIKIHENLFVVKKQQQAQDDLNSFRLIKRNLVINQENQSSQILRAHQSNNRITFINKKPIKKKWAYQFIEYLKKILIRGL